MNSKPSKHHQTLNRLEKSLSTSSAKIINRESASQRLLYLKKQIRENPIKNQDSDCNLDEYNQIQRILTKPANQIYEVHTEKTHNKINLIDLSLLGRMSSPTDLSQTSEQNTEKLPQKLPQKQESVMIESDKIQNTDEQMLQLRPDQGFSHFSQTLKKLSIKDADNKEDYNKYLHKVKRFTCQKYLKILKELDKIKDQAALEKCAENFFLFKENFQNNFCGVPQMAKLSKIIDSLSEKFSLKHSILKVLKFYDEDCFNTIDSLEINEELTEREQKIKKIFDNYIKLSNSLNQSYSCRKYKDYVHTFKAMQNLMKSSPQFFPIFEQKFEIMREKSRNILNLILVFGKKIQRVFDSEQILEIKSLDQYLNLYFQILIQINFQFLGNEIRLKLEKIIRKTHKKIITYFETKFRKQSSPLPSLEELHQKYVQLQMLKQIIALIKNYISEMSKKEMNFHQEELNQLAEISSDLDYIINDVEGTKFLKQILPNQIQTHWQNDQFQAISSLLINFKNYYPELQFARLAFENTAKIIRDNIEKTFNEIVEKLQDKETEPSKQIEDIQLKMKKIFEAEEQFEIIEGVLFNRQMTKENMDELHVIVEREKYKNLMKEKSLTKSFHFY